jgi:hypothetical protein
LKIFEKSEKKNYLFPFVFAINSEGVTPVYFLKALLKEDLDLNPSS